MSDLNVKIYDAISNIKENQWNNVVIQSKLGSFFHRHEWLKAIEDGIGLKAKHIVVLKNADPIGIFPNFVVSIKKTPFKRLFSTYPGFGGPIIATQEKEVLDLMLEHASRICGGNIVSHYISALNLAYNRYGDYFDEKGYKLKVGSCRFSVDLSKGYEEIKSNMTHQRRRELKKIYKKDVEILDDPISDKTIKNFYEVYKRALQGTGGDVLPFPFFEILQSRMSNRIKIFSAFVEQKHVGRVLCFLDNEQSSLHGFFSAIEDSNLRYHPWDLLNDYAIKWGIENNYKKYDMGSSRADFRDGSYRFKESFGGQVVPTPSWEKVYSKLRWNLFKAGKYLHLKTR